MRSNRFIFAIALVALCAWVHAPVARAEGNAPPASKDAAAKEKAPSPDYLAWLQLCVHHLASEDENVRAGAAVALRAAGDAARPMLQTAATNDHEKLSEAAKRLLAQMDRSPRSHRSGAQPVPGYRQGRSAGRVVDALGLDDERKAAVEPVLAEADRERQELIGKLQSGEIPRSDAGSRIAALQRETEEKLGELLDGEQMERYRELTRSRTRSPARP